ncbi:FAD-dependent oxidoreductase [Amycolatopsis sp. MtRt-6]|uniref:NAD(P)/FAD-dependent oxidoreductase n=1 Tax=Amycolatopsis sp. MtRt-6 TaxID=2792782 RepID=UPI0027DB3927|nr:FAD-dependent oxidoreductase [Amycolatopsis sp. MtRt-6]
MGRKSSMRADVVVIGAGVVGASVAFELAKAGYGVVVVDKAAGVGHGSTSASSAVVRFNFSTAAGVDAAWESRACWESWADHLELPAGHDLARYVRTGLAMLDVDLAPRKTYLPLFDAAGIPYEEWDSATLAARVPGIDVGKYWPPKRVDDDAFWKDAEATLGAVYTPDGGYVNDPQLAARNLADAAATRGAEFRLGREVVGIDRGERVTGVRLAGGERLACAIVVNAAGPWSSRVNALAGVGGDFTVGLRPMRQEVHHVPAPEPLRTKGICFADMDLGTYVRPETGGGLLVGGTEPECDPVQWLDDPDALNPNPTQAVFDAQVTRAARRLPELAVPNRARGVAGVYDVADDWTPIYDQSDLPGFYVAIGTSGNQFKNAPVVGRFLAAIVEQVENGRSHDEFPVRFHAPHTGAEIDLAAFSRRRPLNSGSSGTVMG